MNCIYCCVFFQEKYVEMFLLLLESILLYGELEDTEILVYTSTSFMQKIKESILFNDKIKFELNDHYNDIDTSCKARLDLFHLPSILNYNKILYLDTDVLIKDSISKVFDVCKEDVLYVLEEGTIDSDTDFWGKTLFGDEVNHYTDKTAFTSGVLLFHRCQKIKELFRTIQEDMATRTYSTYFYDQPYIVYHAFKSGLYENKMLKTMVINNHEEIENDFIIHHFPGTPGLYSHKMRKMKTFLNQLKSKRIYVWENGMVFI